MAIYTRENEYIRLLAARDHTVKELADKLFISEPTVRRDVVKMKEKELVTCHRGVVSIKRNSADKRIPLHVRDLENIELKKQIALEAASHINDGDVIMLDASTSAQCIIPHLTKFKDIFVITNGINSAAELASLGIKTVCCGGELTSESFSFIGPDAETVLGRYFADVAFFSCRGLDDNGVASDNSILENNLRRLMIKNSKRKYLLCDSSKLFHRYLNKLCDSSELDGIICDIPLK